MLSLLSDSEDSDAEHSFPESSSSSDDAESLKFLHARANRFKRLKYAFTPGVRINLDNPQLDCGRSHSCHRFLITQITYLKPD
jgi:hypothetical protein